MQGKGKERLWILPMKGMLISVKKKKSKISEAEKATKPLLEVADKAYSQGEWQESEETGKQIKLALK